MKYFQKKTSKISSEKSKSTQNLRGPKKSFNFFGTPENSKKNYENMVKNHPNNFTSDDELARNIQLKASRNRFRIKFSFGLIK